MFRHHQDFAPTSRCASFFKFFSDVAKNIFQTGDWILLGVRQMKWLWPFTDLRWKSRIVEVVGGFLCWGEWDIPRWQVQKGKLQCFANYPRKYETDQFLVHRYKVLVHFFSPILDGSQEMNKYNRLDASWSLEKEPYATKGDIFLMFARLQERKVPIWLASPYWAHRSALMCILSVCDCKEGNGEGVVFM